MELYGTHKVISYSSETQQALAHNINSGKSVTLDHTVTLSFCAANSTKLSPKPKKRNRNKKCRREKREKNVCVCDCVFLWLAQKPINIRCFRSTTWPTDEYHSDLRHRLLLFIQNDKQKNRLVTVEQQNKE